MLKKQQRWIALFVALTFIWLMQVSTMPIAAAGSSAQASLASAEPGPDYVEAVAHKAAPAKKKSILPWILIGAGVLTLTAVALFVWPGLLKTKYEIVGTWTVKWQWTVGSSASDTVTAVFSGTKKSGNISIYDDFGPYTVDGKKVTWTLSSYDPSFVWTGEFDSKDTMSGTMVLPSYGESGTWTATRVGTAASAPEPSAAMAKKSSWK